MQPAAGTDSLGVLDRMTALLEAFDEEDAGLAISELAARAGLPKSTVSRLVASLVRQRYLQRDGKLIRLGLRLFELGQLADEPHKLRRAALPVMADLRHATGATVHLAMRDGCEMICIAFIRGRSSASHTWSVGSRLPGQLSRRLADARCSAILIEGRAGALDMAGVGGPVFSRAGEVVAAITASGPADEFEPDAVAPAVVSAAAALGRRLVPETVGED